MVTVIKCVFGFICAIGCISSPLLKAQTSVLVKNNLSFERNEVVSVPVSRLKSFLDKNKEADVRIKNSKGQLVTIQWIDNDGDGNNDELLFMAHIHGKSSENYTMIADGKSPVPESKVTTYSRLVPERVDDYAWENEKIAFRMYGPKGQKEALAGVKGSTLSSGVDIWL